MSIKRMDHTSVVVRDLDAAIGFFTALGMELEGKMPVTGSIVDRLCGVDGIQADVAMMRTPDGHSRIELTKYHSPEVIVSEPAFAPPHTLGLRQIMFEVDDINDTVVALREQGADLVGEIVQYGESYLLCYLRGPEGIIVALAQALS